MLRFLFTPRWMGLLLVVIVLGITCVKLSQWQFHRYDERQHSNEITERNLSADSVAVDTVLSTTHEPSSEDEWQTVRAVGHYDPGHQLAVLYRTQQGAAGVEVVVPLVTRSGAALLVDRGWIPSAANGQRHPDLPKPPAGSVTVTGWARVDSNGSADETKPSDGSVRAISADAIEKTVPYQLYDGFVELTKETPSVSNAPDKPDKPDLSGGPSFFYGWQWLFFAVLFFGFWCYFAWAEYQRQKNPSKESSPADHPKVTVDGSGPRPPEASPR